MQKYLSFFLFILITASHAAAQTDKTKEIDNLMNAAQKIGVFNGTVLVATQGKIIYEKGIGYADASRTKMLTPDIRFDIGSVSKEFNGVAIMMLAEQGKLRLDDKVSKFLPLLPKWAEKIEVRHLLQYTSGLPVVLNAKPGAVNANSSADEDTLESLLNLQKLEFEPGTAYLYSIPNVFVQKRIIEKIAGISYKEFVEQNILKPCGMTGASVDLPVTSPEMARAFDNNYVETKNNEDTKGWVRLAAADLYKWTRCLHSYKVINKGSFDALSERFGDNESSLGVVKSADGKLLSHRHQGSNYNFEALMNTNFSDDIAVILLTNNQNFKVDQIKDAIEAILKGQPYTVPKKSIYLDLREKVLADFEKGVEFYNEIRKNGQDKYDFRDEAYDLSRTGKYLMRRFRYDDAIRMFELNILADPSSKFVTFTCENIGEAYLKKGSRQMAIVYYRKAVELDPTNKNARGMLDQILKSP